MVEADGHWFGGHSLPGPSRLQLSTFENFPQLQLKMLSTCFLRIIMVLLIQSEAPRYVEALDCSHIVDGNIRFPFPGCARILPDKVHFEGNDGPLVHNMVETINAPTDSKGNPDCSGTQNQIEICCSQKGPPVPESILIRTWIEYCRYSNGNQIPRNQG
ncbi:hypothetical protein PGT21_010175 [Puccinia graminis f. sp. tritici]|uniref:Uncharacterized protein n=1 Tax=Puccinia graminis f. sp. tritici TaxID=56615 RepID=A0A5B0N9X5_PUCGR|nr:hypothetical protein PGT21_010175 [Puccinia graminis f. sp. tritici]KAA1135946.1 hypothetical protein PGTUg99_006739 [Puccinia graminis f. sp. tritici]